MDFFKQQLARLQQQFASLNASQKMLAVSLMAIMVMTLLWWGKYANNPELEPVLDQDFSTEEIARAATALQAHGIDTKVSGARVLVPADRRTEALAYLSYESILPHDTSAGVEDMSNHSAGGLIDSPAQQEDARIRNKAVVLGAVISHFPRVQSATVVADPTMRRDFEDQGTIPSAGVNIIMQHGAKGDRKLVMAAAELVSSAFAGMSRDHVKVIIDGASWNVPAPGDVGNGGDGDPYIEQVRAFETFYSAKIRQQLSYIDGLNVSVTVKPDTHLVTSETIEYDPKKTVQQEQSVENTSESTSTNSGAGSREVGVGSNVVADVSKLSAAPSNPDTTERETSKTQYSVNVGSKHDHIQQIAPAAEIEAASISVPRSYLVHTWRAHNPTATTDPDDTVIQSLSDKLLQQVKETAKGCLALKDDAAISVNLYTDFIPVDAQAPTASASVGLMLGSHVKEIVLGALALVSLFLVSMLVKKSAPLPALSAAALQSTSASVASATAGRDAAVNAALSKLVGDTEEPAEVGEGTGVLDGVELDADTVRDQQVRVQVSSMIKEDPEAAAAIIKRWLNRG